MPLREASLTASLAVFALGCAAHADAEALLRDGDIVFQTSESGQSLAIQHATQSPYSHMGLLVHREGKPYVFEASATVRYTPFQTWVRKGRGRHFVVKRLRDADARLTPATLGHARKLLRELEGVPYDLTFDWSDGRMYCSELVYKIFHRVLHIRIGALQKLGELKLDDPAVRAKLAERYGENVPLDEPVISPAAMFDSPLLETVLER